MRAVRAVSGDVQGGCGEGGRGVPHPSGFLSSGSSIIVSSTQSDGFLSSGSSISGLGKPQSSTILPLALDSRSKKTSYVPSGLMCAV